MTAATPTRHDPLSILGPVPGFTLTSTGFSDGDTLPPAQVYNGMGLTGDSQSPQLQWSGFPEGTKSFAVTAYDPDAPTMSGFWHWVAVDIPASVTSLPLGAGTSDESLPGGFHLKNDAGHRDFHGAAPPPGHAPHRYIFVVHALDTESLSLDPDTTPAYAMFGMGYRTLARAVLTATFGR